MRLSWALKTFTEPGTLFAALAKTPPPANEVLFRYAIWLGLIPPVCAYLGTTSLHGWDFGVSGKIVLFEPAVALSIAVVYFCLLFGGFFFVTLLMHWMAPTYAAGSAYHSCFALAAVAGTPMMIGGVCHLYPSLVFNIAVFVPAGLWSCYLLYRGLPILLKTEPERSVLMASALIGALLVAMALASSVVMIIWVNGFGPRGLWI